MIGDLRDVESGKSAAFDICIVGAGPAGITIANELIGSGRRVCLIESGGFRDEADSQALYRGESVGHPVVLDEGRYRIFGGSATRWGGRCAKLDPIDFEPRDWVRNSGWPITFADLAPYYDRALKANNFKDPWIADAEVPAVLGLDLPAFTSPEIEPFVWRAAAPDLEPSLRSRAALGYRKSFDWGQAYRNQLRSDRNTHILLHANLTALHGNANGTRIDAITVRSLDHVTMTIKAKVFVLGCGGIENARLLLNAPAPVLACLDPFDVLGRYLAQHPRGSIATLRANPANGRRIQTLFNIHARPRRVPVQYEIGFAVSEQAQREYRILNASAAMVYEAGPRTSWQAGRRIREGLKSRAPYRGILGDIAHVARGIPTDLASLGRRYIRGVPVLFADPTIDVVIDLEQEPNPQSRVMLSSQTDALGMRRTRVDWRISEIERNTARYVSRFVTRQLAELGLGEAKGADWLASDLPVQPDQLQGNYHFIGTTRMSRHPRDGIVNETCRTHGVENLYLAGCSVFPTGGHANPTLTIVALAIRLADHLKTVLVNG